MTEAVPSPPADESKPEPVTCECAKVREMLSQGEACGPDVSLEEALGKVIASHVDLEQQVKALTQQAQQLRVALKVSVAAL